MLVGMKMVTSERTPVLQDDGSLVQFKEGSGTPVEYRTLSEAHRGDGCAAASDCGEGRVGSVGSEIEPQQSLSRAEIDWLTSESKFFLVQACADRQDRLTRYCMAVLKMLVEGHR
jgi:hypothetical protein